MGPPFYWIAKSFYDLVEVFYRSSKVPHVTHKSSMGHAKVSMSPPRFSLWYCRGFLWVLHEYY